MAGELGSRYHSNTPTSEPNVPGANGTYPTPRHVAKASGTTFIRRGYSIRAVSGAGAHDARAGTTVVETAAVPAEQRRHEAEPRRYHQQHPHYRAHHRMAEIDRCVWI